MKKQFLLQLFLLFLSVTLLAQVPAGYYNSAIGKKQAELKTALHLIIKTANVPSYGSGTNSTWAAFAKMDIRPEDGTVWDMYSNNHVAFNGNSAASGMNIEHSFAKSWWGDGRQAAQDVQHLCPSNSTANSAKGSWPMAVVDGKITFGNGCIKVGKSSSKAGMALDAWEPADEYKGDFARMYMYMVTCYEDYATLWTGNSVNQLDNNTYPVFEQWTVDLLLKWNKQDPVSQKEITRTNEAYKVQGNRNPYIDYPILAEYIWGSLMAVPFTTEGNVTYPYLSTPGNGAILDFGKIVYQQNAVSTLNLKAQNLTGDLTLAISGTDVAEFTIAKTTITKAEAEAGYAIPVNYSAQTLGAKSAQLTISGGGIGNTVVTLKAATSDEFLALPASNILSTSFTTNWTSSANATGYLLDVFLLESNGATAPVTLLEEDFQNGLPANWASVPYTDNAVSGNIRLASGSNSGKITTPAINLATTGNKLTVRARQYSNDAGAPITVALDEQTVATLTTASGNQDFLVDLPAATASSKISLSALAGKRVYVDYVKVQTQGEVQSAVSVPGFPVSVGNVLNYTVEGLQSNKTYYYTVTPQGNSALKSEPVTVQTLISSGLDNKELDNVSYSVSGKTVFVKQIPARYKIRIYNVLGRVVYQQSVSSSDLMIELPQKGLYILQVDGNKTTKQIKVML